MTQELIVTDVQGLNQRQIFDEWGRIYGFKTIAGKTFAIVGIIEDTTPFLKGTDLEEMRYYII